MRRKRHFSILPYHSNKITFPHFINLQIILILHKNVVQKKVLPLHLRLHENRKVRRVVRIRTVLGPVSNDIRKEDTYKRRKTQSKKAELQLNCKREKGAVDLSFDVPRIQMKFHGNLIFFLLVLSIVGDINRIINNPSGGDLISMNSALLMPSADAFTPVRRFGRRIRLPRWPIRRLRPRRV